MAPRPSVSARAKNAMRIAITGAPRCRANPAATPPSTRFVGSRSKRGTAGAGVPAAGVDVVMLRWSHAGVVQDHTWQPGTVISGSGQGRFLRCVAGCRGHHHTYDERAYRRQRAVGAAVAAAGPALAAL